MQEDIREEKRAKNKGKKKLKELSLLGKGLGSLFTFLANLFRQEQRLQDFKHEYLLSRFLVLVVVFGPTTFFGTKATKKYETLTSCPSLVSHICLKIWIIGGCGKKAMKDLYPSGEWKGEKELVDDSRRLESWNEKLRKPPYVYNGKELASLDD